jgi:hypothetical protein
VAAIANDVCSTSTTDIGSMNEHFRFVPTCDLEFGSANRSPQCQNKTAATSATDRTLKPTTIVVNQ